ncbi:hypothetical protein ACPPVU_20340 [Mucilaginibacter sp. McL0603]|uniref:hypothetical protein n=1 Tax=Mucilaginibacter sp. McL0603 TaxID=3415670 RepID=UPI003CF58F1B
MDTVVIRTELHDLINHADDKSLEAIYTVVNEAEKVHEWWKDKELVAELNRRYSDLISGKDKGMNLEQATEHLLNRLR